MDSLYTATGLSAITDRIHRLTPASPRIWGKMDAAQMLAHVRFPLEVPLGRYTLKPMWIMKIFGGSIRRSLLSDKPVKRNSPTAPGFKTDSQKYDFDQEKNTLLRTLNDFASAGKAGKLPARHPYFGSFNAAEWSQMQVKHLDHHLQQFGV